MLVVVSFVLAFEIRFDFRVPSEEFDRALITLPALLAIRLAAFAKYRLFQGLWKYTSTSDVIAILKATIAGSAIFMISTLIVVGADFPRSVYLLEFGMTAMFIAGVRLFALALRQRSLVEGERKALIVGAGDAAESLIRSIQATPELNYSVVGMVDDDQRRVGRRIRGIPVLGRIEAAPHLATSLEVDEILMAIPSASAEEQRRAAEVCRASGVPVRSVPPLRQLLEGTASITQLKRVEPEDLLGREAIQIDVARLREQIGGRRVLVTGAAGSIGAELCRQIASYQPSELVLFERAESNLYFTHLDLVQRHPGLKVVPVIGDILDRQLVQEVMVKHSPHLVYHAAAYKHVPLMEAHPLEAIANNVIGTQVVARAAQDAGVATFVLISTDKAVAPVGVMGMSKRVAEGVLLTLQGGSTTFTAVRFGNVLDSDGSVLPLFRWQIAMGGPVTVTDAEASRYFMLISEAAQLVLQAGAMAAGGEVYFLDMGQPVKIIKLAEDLIRLSKEAGHPDVPIEVVGLRPGERLTEELVRESERLLETGHPKIAMSERVAFDKERFEAELDALRYLVEQRDATVAVERLSSMMRLY
jgi:FlaA1/EpsC-like NDP-sugar epimerase